MPEETPFDKLEKCNDDYHEAVAEILEDSGVEVELRCQFGREATRVFDAMKSAEDVIKAHYKPEGE